MLTFKNHRGQFHKANTALVILTSLYVIGAAVALSTPLWRPSTCKLAAFATTPEAFILAGVTIVLACLAIYTISRNNKISELKASKLSVSGNDVHLVLQVSSEDSKFIEENYGDKYRIDCANSKGEVYRITCDDHVLLGSTYLFHVSSLEVKDGEGKYVPMNDRSKQFETLGLGTEENDAKELIIRFVPSSIVKAPETEQGNNGRDK